MRRHMKTVSTVDFNEIKRETVVEVIAECNTPAKRLSFICTIEGVPNYRVESWNSALPIPASTPFTSLEAAVNAYNSI
jgi:hypothetical protein